MVMYLAEEGGLAQYISHRHLGPKGHNKGDFFPERNEDRQMERNEDKRKEMRIEGKKLASALDKDPVL